MIVKLRKLALNGINWYFDQYIGGEKRAARYDISDNCPELLIFDQNYEKILKEYEYVDQHYQLQAYHDTDSAQYTISAMVEPNKKWKIFVLSLCGETPELALKLCPQTCKMLESIPNVYQAFFSVLEPGKPVPAHNGPYRGILRYHLGLKIPAQNPPSIRIKDQIYFWQDGKSFLFDDTWEHEVFNNAKEDRIVLIVDIYRPMPPFQNKVNSFLIKKVIKTLYADKVVKNLKNEKKE